jgi:hypothetical protein
MSGSRLTIPASKGDGKFALRSPGGGQAEQIAADGAPALARHFQRHRQGARPGQPGCEAGLAPPAPDTAPNVAQISVSAPITSASRRIPSLMRAGSGKQ